MPAIRCSVANRGLWKEIAVSNFALYVHAAVGMLGMLASAGIFAGALNAREISRERIWWIGIAVALFTGLIFGRLLLCDVIRV
jgi:hypothetical protein